MTLLSSKDGVSRRHLYYEVGSLSLLRLFVLCNNFNKPQKGQFLKTSHSGVNNVVLNYNTTNQMVSNPHSLIKVGTDYIYYYIIT